MRLPSFVTAQAIAQVLGWAKSIRRQVSQTAMAQGIDGWTANYSEESFYDNIVRLLATPTGGRRLSQLVAVADPDKQRTLSRAVQRMVAHDLNGSIGQASNPADLVSRLLRADCGSSAAWLAFDVLSYSEPSEAKVAPLDAMVAVIEADDVVRSALGDFWTDWSSNCGRSQEVPPQSDDRHEAEWREAIDIFRAAINGASPFDSAVVQNIRDCADALQSVLDRRVESQAQANERARRREETRNRMRLAIGQLPPGLDWVSRLLAFLDTGSWEQASPEELESCAGWLEMACITLEAAEALHAEAKAQFDDDDSDTNFNLLTDARSARREERAVRQAEAEQFFHRLGWSDFHPQPVITGWEDAKQFPKDVLVPDVRTSDVKDAATDDQATAGANCSPIASDTALPPVDAPAVVGLPHRDLEFDSETLAWSNGSDTDSRFMSVVDPALPIAEAVTERALRDRRYGLAAHVARAAETLGAESVAGAGSAVLRALCVGDALDEMRRAPVEVHFGNLLPSILVEIDGARSNARPRALLVLAGALRPALFSSHTGAAEAIRRVDLGKLGPDLRRLADFIIADLPRRGGALDLAAIGPEVDPQILKGEVAEARLRILELADAAPTRKAAFARASHIWRELFQTEPVRRAVMALRAETPDVVAVVEAAAEWLGKDVDEKATELDRQARKKHDEALEGKSLDWLRASLEDLEKRLRQWIVAQRRASRLRPSHPLETRNTLRDLLAAALKDVSRLASEPSLETASIVCQRSIEDVAALLEGRSPPPGLPDIDMFLHDDLLTFNPYPEHARRDEWTPTTATTFIIMAQGVVSAPSNFSAAFERLLAQKRFSEAEQAAARMAAEGNPHEDAAGRIRDARARHLHEMRRAAERLHAQADDLLGADIDGKIDPAVAVRLEALSATLGEKSSADEDVSERLDFASLQVELGRIDAELQVGADILLAPFQQEIDGQEASGLNVDYLRELFRKRDLTSLRDSLAGATGSSEASGSAEERNMLLQTFGQHFASRTFASRPVQDRAVGKAIEDARHGRHGPALDFSELSEADREQAVKLLQAWQELLASKSGATALRDLLLELRLTGVKVEKETPQDRARAYRVGLDVTTDRRDCPVPAFGSAAPGRLNVLVAELPSLDGTDLHRRVRAFEDGSVVPVLVIVKGLIPAEQRVRFMREARKNASQNPCAMLDEASILFLATRRGRTRGDMFATALPAGGVQPYSNASSKSSPEMFFGRSEELAKLWEQGGSCLVYGGRQLGKTALLQQVRVRYHKPPSQVVPYGSLQGQKELWPLIGKLLSESGVPCQRRTRQGVTTAIREWLDQDMGRRLLILVDEADTFLSAEVAEGYESLIVVRDLMQETDRRCKFVFAGLHDVQRLARTPNSPLHHLGMPLGIGPLFGKDLQDARQMVTIPMAAAGVAFDGLSLPNRILSAVGFYPSLLQTFGDTLLSRIGRSVETRIKPDMPLPLLVTDQDVAGALEDNDFKKDIINKFGMTLNLDERYRLITLAILHRMLEMREEGLLAPPLTDVKIQELARSWWPQGFAEDASLSSFQGLLQEMVGLGVLLQSGDRFAIRSSRIAAMLGGKEQIDQQLLELSERPRPETLDTGSLRRLDTVDHTPAPLTFRQESLLVDWERQSSPVYLTLSSKALGLDDLASSLSELPADDFAVQVRRYDSKRTMEAGLAEAVRTSKAGHRNLAILSGPWLGRDMVDMALAVAVIRKNSRGLRVLLVPQMVDWEAADAEEGGKLWGAEVLTLSALGRTGLRQWLRAKDWPETPDAIDRLRAWTGGFANLFRRLPATAARDPFGERTKTGASPLSPTVSLGDLGLEDARLLAAARAIVDYEVQDDDYALAAMEEMEIPNFDKVLEHLERLGIVERSQSGGGRLDVNPLVRRILETAG